MKVGVLGSGIVGRTLGAGLAERGHEVMLGTRHPRREELRAWAAAAGERVRTGSFAEAAGTGEVLVLAVDWRGAQNALQLAGPERLAAKVLVDVTNPLDFSSGLPPRLDIGHTDSGAEQIQRWAPGARVVKAFNTVIARHMVAPQSPIGPPVLFVAGDDTGAKALAIRLAAELGWRGEDTGPLARARLLEPMALFALCRMLDTGRENFIVGITEVASGSEASGIP
jgi:predicted dinucleotide-binding enzyme